MNKDPPAWRRTAYGRAGRQSSAAASPRAKNRFAVFCETVGWPPGSAERGCYGVLWGADFFEGNYESEFSKK